MDATKKSVKDVLKEGLIFGITSAAIIAVIFYLIFLTIPPDASSVKGVKSTIKELNEESNCDFCLRAYNISCTKFVTASGRSICYNTTDTKCSDTCTMELQYMRNGVN
jgi:hypothetical protein